MNGLNGADKFSIFEWSVEMVQSAKGSLKRIAKRLRLKLQSKTSRPLRVVIGSGGIPVPGWLVTDIDQLNILADGDWRRYFAPGSIDTILAEHVWEHFSMDEGAAAARLCFRYLRLGGRLRIAVPDGLHPDPGYVNAVRPGGTGPGAEDHKVLYTWRAFQNLFQEAGFSTRLLEYFDEKGQFHAVEWNPSDGMIRRSLHFDSRNAGGDLNYSSIVIDAIKPHS